MNKHSPGPWRFYDGWILGRDGHILETNEPGNGRLAAAAPEMLELLREVLKDSPSGFDTPWRREVRALLARIDGETP
jgi:hypothetical protein